jgi:ABC-type uncharacterized transport system substrate-binding protein
MVRLRCCATASDSDVSSAPPRRGESFDVVMLTAVWMSQTLAGEIDAMGVVYKAVEDGVGISRIAEHGAMPQ